jgi:putative ABC transport system substrate-binding protein
VKRRDFIALIGGAATWPLVARAQQPAMPTIAYLGPTSPDAVAGRLRAFREGLKEIGYIEGENVAIGYRFAEGQNDQLPAMAIELARRQVSVLVTGATPATFAAKAATTTIPIVFILSEDPVRLGIVASIPRPGGNATGINFVSGELGAKRLELLRELLPGAVRIRCRISRNHGQRGGNRCSRNGLAAPDPQRQQQQ